MQLASAVTVSTSATPGIVSYSVPAPAYGAFTATIDFTSGAGFIKDVDTVPAILQFANQGTSVSCYALAFAMAHTDNHDLTIATHVTCNEMSTLPDNISWKLKIQHKRDPCKLGEEF